MFKTRTSFLAAAAVFPLLASACGRTAPPDSAQLREQFGVEIPAYWRAGGFTLEASELSGRAGDRFRGRFKATISLTTPTYVEDHWDGEVLFVRQVGRVGIRKTVYGRVEGTLAGRGWNTRMLMENDPTRTLGTPRDFFNAPRVIIAGSPEDAAYREAQRRQQEEAARQAQASLRAEQQRLEEMLVGEWHGSAFSEKDSRLVVRREGGGITALLYHQGYIETLRVESLAGNRFLLTGTEVVRIDGGRVNYNLDTFDVQVTDGTLTGVARDVGGESGGIAMRKVLDPALYRPM